MTQSTFNTGIEKVTMKVVKPKVEKVKKQSTLGNTPILIKNNCGRDIFVQGTLLKIDETRRIIVDQEIKNLITHKYIIYV